MERRSISKGFTLIELLVVLAIIGLLFTLIMGGAGGGFSISDGDRVGIITKFSQNKGVAFKTCEGQMILGGQGTVTSNVWEFSIAKENIEIIKKIQEALDTQKLVKLSYHQYLFTRPWLGSTTYFIQRVETVDKK
jgi:prepilin-type N-terminal cleavage/methylation domain-containing protein